MEQGFNEVPRRRAGDPFSIYDEMDFPIRSAEILPYREDHRPCGNSQEDHQRSMSTLENPG